MAIDVTQTNFDAGAAAAIQNVQTERLATQQQNQLQVEERANVARSSADNDNRDSNVVIEQEIEAAVTDLSDFVQAQRRNLNFSFNEEANRSIVRVTDDETGDLIRQIPSEEVLQLSERIRGLRSDIGEAVGVLFSREV